MSIFSGQGNVIWSFNKEIAKSEPFEELLFKECSFDVLQKKIEFLEREVLLLNIQCDALEYHMIKEYSEFLDPSVVIDVSWMPYHLQEKEKPKIRKIQDVVKRLNRKKPNQKTTKSIFSIARRVTAIRKIGLNHLIFLLERTTIHMVIDFDKDYYRLGKKCKQIENEAENFKSDCQQIQQRIMEYRSKILEAGLDKLTKRIPAGKYKRFVKHQYMKRDIQINGNCLRLSNVVNDKKSLEKILDQMKKQAKKLSEVDYLQLKLKFEKLNQEAIEKNETETIMTNLRINFRQNYLLKMYKIDKTKNEIYANIKSIKREIEKISNKIKSSIGTHKPTMIDDDSNKSDTPDEIYNAIKTTDQEKIVNTSDVEELCPQTNVITTDMFHLQGTTSITIAKVEQEMKNREKF